VLDAFTDVLAVAVADVFVIIADVF